MQAEIETAVFHLEAAEATLKRARSTAFFAILHYATRFVGIVSGFGADASKEFSAAVSLAILDAEAELRRVDPSNTAALEAVELLADFPHGGTIGPWKAKHWLTVVRSTLHLLRGSA